MTHPLLIATCVLAVLGSAHERERAVSDWTTSQIMNARTKLGGCAIGDVDPNFAGNEIVVVSERGEVFVAAGPDAAERWISWRIAESPGELIQCAIGDADASTDGNEIVAVGLKLGTEDEGGAGIARLLSRGESGWTSRVILEDSALLHAVLIADIDPEHAGAEIFVAGFGKKLWVIANGGATSEVACELDGAAKSLHAFNGGVAVACANGELVHVTKGESGWTKTTIYRTPAGLARLGGSDRRLAVASDDGRLVLIDSDGTATPIHREEKKLRGAALCELDPEFPGLEAATAGYLGEITVLVRKNGEWQATVVYSDKERFHHLATGELIEGSPGLEIVACGLSGKLILAYKHGS